MPPRALASFWLRAWTRTGRALVWRHDAACPSLTASRSEASVRLRLRHAARLRRGSKMPRDKSGGRVRFPCRAQVLQFQGGVGWTRWLARPGHLRVSICPTLKTIGHARTAVCYTAPPVWHDNCKAHLPTGTGTAPRPTFRPRRSASELSQYSREASCTQGRGLWWPRC
jgi:hypothetical protein